MTSGVLHRLATEADMQFADYTFLASFRSSYYAGPLAPWDAAGWKEMMMPAVRRVLRAPGVEVHVAVNPEMTPESKSDIFGWLAVNHRLADPTTSVPGPKQEVVRPRASCPLVIFCYVKHHYRGYGFAKGLFAHVGIDPFADRYEYPARTEALMQRPGENSQWRTPLVERMTRAQWNPRATRGGHR